MNERFNLVDEPWIPVVGHPRVSLKEIFSNPDLKALRGNAIQKLALLKLFLAVAQRAYTPLDDNEWQTSGSSVLAERCIRYLEERRDLFWLYGSNPFLQRPDLKNKKNLKGENIPVSSLGRDYLPDLASENDSILIESQREQKLTDAQKAVFIITLMNYSLGGKRVAKNIPPWTEGYTGKSTSAKGAPSIGNYEGYLSSHLIGSSIIETVWINLLTRTQLEKFPKWKHDRMIPPWEEMPKGEDDERARELKSSYMATLLAMSRFVLLKDDGIMYTEGLQYPSHKEGWRETFMTYSSGGKILWCNLAKKPWRNLPALVSASFSSGSSEFFCPQISLLLLRTRTVLDIVGIWSGGLKVRTTAGDTSVKQSDDYIDTHIFLATDNLGDSWYISLTEEMLALEKLSKSLWSASNKYFEEMGREKSTLKKKHSEKKTLLDNVLNMFWELCEHKSQDLVKYCNDTRKMKTIRRTFSDYAIDAYNKYCPRDTSKQLIAWAKHRSFIYSYLSVNTEEVVHAK